MTLAVSGLILAFVAATQARADQPPLPMPPADAVATEPVVGAKGSLITQTQERLNQSLAGTSAVFAPYPGKSPCGEFDSPYNTYFGDNRVYRSVVLGRLWTEFEYLAWQSKGVSLPPLVTTGPPGGMGVIGDPGTTILFGNQQVQDNLRSGGRLNLGYWFTPEHERGVELHLMWIDGQNLDQFADGALFPILAIPFLDAANADTPAATLISDPGTLDNGSVLVRSQSEFFGLEVLGRRMIRCGDESRLDFVAGYRFARLFDSLRVDAAFTDANVMDNLISDAFVSKNDFHGGEIGLVHRWWNCCWATQVFGKAAFGETHTVTTIDGSTLIGAGPATPGGVFARPSNIGDFTQEQFSVLAELGARVEYAVTPQLRLTLGYNYLYWSRVARVPDSLDGTGGAAPTFDFVNTDFWSQGLSASAYYDF